MLKSIPDFKGKCPQCKYYKIKSTKKIKGVKVLRVSYSNTCPVCGLEWEVIIPLDDVLLNIKMDMGE